MEEAQITGEEAEALALSIVIQWCAENLPECLAQIPTRRHQQFADGIVSAYADLEDENDERMLKPMKEEAEL